MGMSPVPDNPVILPDRELEEEKKLGASEPPLIRWSAHSDWYPG